MYLIALFSNPGDIVLDPFGGSGSTGEAALDMGRRPIVIERDDKYSTAIRKRLEKVVKEKRNPL
jgi:site-specific DNA-methyltransferase (adenine-specific)